MNTARSKLTLEHLIREGVARTGDASAVKKLAMHAFDLDASGIISKAQYVLGDAKVMEFDTLLSRLQRGEPVYRILGAREFHGLSLSLSDETLEPRDDTECLIDITLLQIDDQQAPLCFADLGTGTGAVALALLSELPNATAVVTDISQNALDTAQLNAVANGLADRLEYVHGDWLEPLSGKFDFIVSNPPYIESLIVDTLAPQVREYDPLAALDGGTDGLSAYRSILGTACFFLNTSGFLALEIGFDQLASVSDLASQFGWKRQSMVHDLAGNDRAIVFKMF